MANNKIQIKRSATNAVIPALSNGELAFTQSGNTFWIGAPDGSSGNIRIGGQMVPGTLTANQALVANSTSGIDKIIVANAAISQLNANGSTGTAGQILKSGGAGANSYWSDTAAGVAGTDTQVQYNDAGSLAGAAGFTFAKASNNVSIANNLSVTANVASNNYTAGANYGGASAGMTANATIVGVSSSTTVNSSITAALIQVSNSTSTANLTALDLKIGATTVVNSSQITATVLSGNLSASYANISGQVNTATLYAATSANVGTYFTVNSTSANLSVNTTIGATNTYITSNVTISGANVDATSAVLRVRDAIVSGNLTVSGTVTAIDTTTLQVKDNVIQLADQQASTSTFTDAVDAGFYVPTGNTLNTFYSGLARVAASSSNVNPYFKLYSTTVSPNNTILDTGATTGTLQAYLTPYGTGGALVANSTVVNITANSTLSVALTANTLSLTTALPATSGGTGTGTYTSGDILVANTGNVLNKLTLGTSGYVLQSDGTKLVYDILDGGTF